MHKLADYRPVSNDEGELMAVGYKLATRGVLGSDMYTGFFGGDQHHFETLPLQDVLEAVSFRVLQPGVAQARLVSVLAAIVLLWVVGWLAFRWYGLATALLAELLLVAWRSNLTAASGGLPLLGVARSARYDVLAVTSAWLAIAALDFTIRRPGAWRALATGGAAGLAALAQFFGAFTLPLVLVGLTWIGRGRVSLLFWVIAGAALVVSPYVLFAATSFGDLVGQLSVYGDRGDFLRAGFYAENLIAEPGRYAHLLSSLDGGLLVLGIGPCVAYLVWRSRERGEVGDRLLLLSLLSFGGLLALLDRTKVPLYAVLVLPSVCVCLAVGVVHSVRWCIRRGRVPRLLGIAAVLAVGVVLVSESVDANQAEWLAADRVTSYLALGEQIDAAVSPGASLIGPERWWWALRGHPYVSMRSIWFQWTAESAAGDAPRFRDWVARAEPEALIVNINVEADIQAFPLALQAQFWDFIAQCTEKVAEFQDVNYFDTGVYRVSPGCR